MIAESTTATATSLVQRYADLEVRAGGISASVRGMRFNALLADALVRDGVDADADRRGPNGEVDVAFFLDGTWYLMEAKWYTDPITVEPLRQLRDILTQRRPGTIGILASRSGFDDSARRRAAEVRDVVLFDRPHLEALIGGVATGSELVTAANRSIAVYGQPDVPLAALLRPRRPDPAPLQLGVPEEFTTAAVAAPDGVDATVVAHGPAITGVGVDGDRLLVAVTDGVMDLGNHRRSRPRRRLELTGGVGDPMVTADGDLLVVRGSGVLRVAGDEVVVAAGGFARAPLLVPGPGGVPWLLDRRGRTRPTERRSATGSPSTEHAALVEPGAGLGDARRWPAGLPAGACQAACWLRDRTFFVLGAGHSAVIDIDTGRYEWIITPVGQPHGLVRLDERRVLLVGADRYVQTVVLDTVTHAASPPTAVNLAGPVRSATRIGDAVYVLARAPLDHATTVPVVARLDLGRIGATC
ncbi:restriction endonuclease [Dactylosporangium sp. NBC_01737]|uniref:restriction endonuclease n=1 Tax=Dactylosporangium sp. NBC_01737 TaxID=2975959 RepID=UPI002E0F90E1|nr:restriction endonuclease [Dactylosporangium sp. NBC_01737]